MAYTPVSGNKKGGYVPVSKKRAVVPATPKATTLPPAEVPFDATKTGIAVNTVLGIPQAALDAASSARKFLFPKKEEIFQQMQEEKKQSLAPTPEVQKEIDIRGGGFTLPSQKERTFAEYLKAPSVGLPDFAGVAAITKNVAKKVFQSIAKETDESKIVKLIQQNFADVVDEKVAKEIAPSLKNITDEVEVEKVIQNTVAKNAPTPTAPVRVADEVVPTPVKQDVPTAPARVADDVADPRNYKSAEEFVKAQGTPVYRGTVGKNPEDTSNGLKILPDATFTTTAKQTAKGYAGDTGTVHELIISPDAKFFETSPQEIAQWLKKKERELFPLVQEQQMFADAKKGVVKLDEITKKNIEVSRQAKEEYGKWLKSNGYDGYSMQREHGFEYAVINKDKIKTKSQLTDIWNKAQTSNLPPLPKGLRPQTPDEIINSALERYRVTATKPETVLPEVAKAGKVPTSPGGFMIMSSKLLTPISSRLARINPKLKEVLRKFEYNVAQNTHKDSTRILPLLNATKQLSKEESLIFDLARKNGDADVINAIAKKYGFEKELRESQRVLDEIYDRATEVGIEIPYRDNYFPRVVKNPEKYVAYLRSKEDWSEIQAMVEKHAADKGKKYTDLTSEEIAGIVNNYLRGFGNKVDLAKPGFAKQRSVEVIDDTLNDFYESSDSALSTYIIRMNDEIEGRKFFGKALKTDEKVLNTEDSIGAYVMDLIQKGELKPQYEREVSDILKARFARGKMNGALDTFRNMEYISTMGSPISAITQIGDLAWSIYDNGLFNTAKAFSKSAFGKAKNRVTKEDLGIEQITQEFTGSNLPYKELIKSKEWAKISSKILDKTFKLVGMERLDRLGKETLVNAEFSKFQNLAKKGDAKLQQTLAQTFDQAEVPQVMKEFAEGKVTDNTRLVLFNKLLDFQPVAKSEMPQAYLENPNGRIFYMLKSFTLKQYDIFRREAIDKIASGDKKQVAEGMKNLVLLAGAFTMANATADEIKDLVLGRETPPSDRVVDNLWRLVGASKYDVYKARTDGVGQTILKKILFPTSLFDRAYQDISNTLEDKRYEKGPLKGQKYKLESTQSIPLGGKLYYWWAGRGAQKEEYKKGGTKDTGGTLPELPTLPKLPKLPKLPQV